MHALDDLAQGITTLADAVAKAEREARYSRWINMLVGAFVCFIGSMTMIELRGAVKDLHAWERRLSAWEDKQEIHERRMGRALEVTETVVASLQQLIESETARDQREREKALGEAERLALLTQVKALSAQIAEVKEEGNGGGVTQREIVGLTKKLSDVKATAAKSRVPLGDLLHVLLPVEVLALVIVVLSVREGQVRAAPAIGGGDRPLLGGGSG